LRGHRRQQQRRSSGCRSPGIGWTVEQCGSGAVLCDNKVAYIRFHAIQCIGLSIAAIAAHIIAMLIPVIGWILAPFISLAFLVIWIIAILKASKGEWFKIPFIGPFAEKQAKNG
jgi:uncharacterized membrane protein